MTGGLKIIFFAVSKIPCICHVHMYVYCCDVKKINVMCT